MTEFVFNPEGKETDEVMWRYPFLPGPNGEPPLSPVEIYKRKRKEFSRQQERAAEEKEAERALEKAAKTAMEKALKEAVKDLNK